MEKQLPLVRSAKACVTGALMVALPFLFFMLPGQRILGPLPAVYASMLILYLLPTALCLTAAVCGLAASAAGLMAALACMATLTGPQGLALAELGRTEAHAVYVGDSEVDIATARNAGLPCLSVGWGFRPAQVLLDAGAKEIIPDVPALLARLLD